MAHHRLLVIANETIAGESLHSHIKEIVAPDGRVIIVAPALSSRLKYVFSDVDGPREQAQERLDESIELLRASGLNVEGEVGDASPMRAFQDAVAVFQPDGVLISTHPPGKSNWLENGLIDKMEAVTDLPVEHVVVDLEVAQRTAA